MEEYNGEERRLCPNRGACLDHAGFGERIKANEKKIDEIEKKGYVPFSNYKWIMALLVSIFVSLFGIAIHLANKTNDSLRDLVIKQEILIHTVSKIEEDLKDLKRRPSNP